MTNQSALESLTAGLAHLEIQQTPQPFMDYLQLLSKWNQNYNLTALKELDSMVTHHILDSLSILPWIEGHHVLDIGSGAGLPGIPLALVLPDKHFVLIDSNGKKTRFMQEAKRVLRLTNVDIVQTRVETFQPPIKFDTILSRAFSDLTKMLSLSRHLLAKSGMWLAMKGRVPQEELQTLDRPYQVKHYTVFGMEDEERCCIILK